MNKYVFKPWSPIFPTLFDKERKRIAPHLKKALAIEHVGSTAVRDLGGKGIIDIAIAARREDMEATSEQLQALGYEFRPTFSTPERFYFIIYLPDPEEGTRRYHVHLTFPESSEWKGLIDFRDYLRAHPEDVREYAALKQQAALESNQEGSLYRKIKEPIIQKIHAMIDASTISGDAVGDRWTVRPFQKADLDAVMDLFQQVVHTTGAKYYQPEQIQAWAPSEGLDREAWLSSLTQNISYVVEIAGTITGFGDMTRAGHIERLYVHPKYQGQGMARALMKKFEEEAKALGLKTLTTDASVIAMPLLKRFGYEVIRKYTKLHRGVEFTNYFMQKTLLKPQEWINDTLVRHLVAAQFPQWKDLPVRPVALSGWDNRTFHLGEEMLVRMPSSADYASQVEKEQRWLPKLAPHLPLPIPVPLAIGEPMEEYPWKWSIYRWLEGESAATGEIADLSEFAENLAHFLADLEGIDATGGPVPGPHSFYRGGALSHYDAEVRQALTILKGRIDLDAAARLWEAALVTSWLGNPVWVHGDISAGNLLVQRGRLCAVIDFGQLAVGDPACDLAIAWTLFNGRSRQVFRERLPLDPGTWTRGRAWCLWKALVVAAGFTNPNNVESVRCWGIIEDVLGEDGL